MGEIALPGGFRFAAGRAGVRPSGGDDLALIASDRPCRAAGVFTRNAVAAAPVRVTRRRVPADGVRGVAVCAGNANACTGPAGVGHAERMAELLAGPLDCPPEDVLVASTGVIGVPLPIGSIEAAFPAVAARLSATPEALSAFAAAILTTDTRPKVRSARFGDYTLLGVAKGAAMIGPNMATMLAFLLTDAPAASAELDMLLRPAVDATFNCLSVEGHTSTNDTVLLLANGEGGPPDGQTLPRLIDAALTVCGGLARDIAGDAEGATKLIEVVVEGAGDDAQARRVAKCVADSPLVKTAVHGHDPNWGRVVSAAGYAGVAFDEADLSLWLGETLLYRGGVPAAFDAAAASAYLRDNREVLLRLKVGGGGGSCRFFTSDLTAEYVRLNSEYTS